MAELSYCAAQARQLDRDRFLCALFAPAAEREALAALYAFNAEVARIPEIVTEPLVGHMRVQWWRDAIEAIFAGRPPAHAVAEALADAVGRYDLPRAPFDRLLDARAADLDAIQPPSLAALVDYAEATSATLATLGLRVLGAPEAEAAARDVGIAWALSGLLRAVPFHVRRQRFMLPADIGRAAGLDPGDVARGRATAALLEVVRAVAEAATGHLDAARARRRDVSERALPVLLAATLAEVDLRRLGAAGYDPFAPGLDRRRPGTLVKLFWRRVAKRY